MAPSYRSFWFPDFFAAPGFMRRRLQRFGRTVRSRLPITGATDDMAAIAARILADAPPRFALAGLSMGGYIAFAMLRRRPSASPSSRCSTPRRGPIRRSNPPRAKSLSPWRRRASSPMSSKRSRRAFCIAASTIDETLSGGARTWRRIPAREAFVRQQRAIMSRPDSRPLLACVRCPTLVLVGDGDELTPPELAERTSRPAFPAPAWWSCRTAGICRRSSSRMQ